MPNKLPKMRYLIFIIIGMLTGELLCQPFDTLFIYNKFATCDPFPPGNCNESYSQKVVYKTNFSNNSYKLKIFYRSNPSIPPSHDALFPQDITFLIDTQKVLLFFDIDTTKKMLVFDFNAKPGDTLSVYGGNVFDVCLYRNSGCLIPKENRLIKIYIKEISWVTFDIIGNKQVYFYELIDPIGMGNVLGGYWVKGLFNGDGGIVNEYINTEPGPIYYNTTCFSIDNSPTINIPTPIKWAPYCTSFTTGISPILNSEFSAICYPNPSSDHITVELKGVSKLKQADFVMYDLSGNIIFSTLIKTNRNEINLSEQNIKSGMYYYSIYLPEVHQMLHGRFAVMN